MQELLNIINKFKEAKVLVVGDLILDEYFWGKVDRISREAPVPVLNVEKVNFHPGGAANVAYNLKVLADKVLLSGVIGDDDKGRCFKKILEEKGILTQGVFIDSTRRTTVKTRLFAKNQQMACVDFESRELITSDLENKILDYVKENIKNVDFIIISDYARGVVTPFLSKSIIDLARQENLLCFVDPRGWEKDYLKYINCTSLSPNEEELAQAVNFHIENDQQFFQAGKDLLEKMNSDSLLVTQGSKGMTLFEKNGIIFVPALNKKARDISGAGDTALAVFALAKFVGASSKDALTISAKACSLAVGKIGTAVVLLEELEEIIKNNKNGNLADEIK